MKKQLLTLAILLFFVSLLSAGEGIWVPALMAKYNIEEMQRMGFRLSAEDVYDVNHASMKDAVVIFGGGCTGELISDQGLLITNHHCGFGQIQRHSTVENDYLTKGFWAASREKELPCPGLTVSFLQYMEDVTEKVLAGTDTLSGEDARNRKIRENSAALEREASQKEKFRAQVRPFFYGNQYFLHVYKIFSDVRLVGAPPSAIGKFGGDTDNWVWPRHTGDFSLFRIYANKENEPAEYSPENKPYRPARFFPISLKGLLPGDFTMVFGYPGRTTRFLTAGAVDLIMHQRNPDRIAIRNKKMEIMNQFMEKYPAVRIQYAAKYAGVSNAWKKWQGEMLGLENYDALKKKQQFEMEFQSWARKNDLWENHYDAFFRESRDLHRDYAPVIRAVDYYNEIVLRGVEAFTLAEYVRGFLTQAERNGEVTAPALKSINRLISSFYKDYHQPVDERLFSALLPLLVRELRKEDLPAGFSGILKKYGEEKLVTRLYRKSILTDSLRLGTFLAESDPAKLRKIEKDPLMALYLSLRKHYDTEIQPRQLNLEERIDEGMKMYVAGILRMEEGKALYPDANSTLRVSYGRVEGYQPQNGVSYKHFTTLKGIIEKDNPEIYDYDVPDRLKELYKSGDYGRYGQDGSLPVCFIASNHTSGGNSGSPVINGDGHLVGINFDRCWEGTMSDIMYDPSVCRNISLDIRYALFLIDKFAGAGYLIDEMEIVEFR
ncbi:MAG TPA: S46 family peptidase [Prolixibacteraceae bacterium]|nr:S46 family peptidase [Prolixibacteraceae bacterium]HPL46450.1 S46 family peptidase [Prolixibacteraceae bacterium]HQE53303.1 S46 family peptidase [Prolixibacteraceae bacterium]HQH77277.1 S46 family peptidase [Prolixibacteraceae bacterium]